MATKRSTPKDRSPAADTPPAAPPAPEGLVADMPPDVDDTTWAAEQGARDDAASPALARAKERLAAWARARGPAPK